MTHQEARGVLLGWLIILIYATTLCCARRGPSSGCGNAYPPYHLGTINDDSVTTKRDGQRTFHVYMPSSYDYNSPTPLVFLFHGGGGTGLGAMRRYGMNGFAELEGFVVVYPDGLHRSWNGGDCCGRASADGVNDIAFVKQMLASLETNLCIDTAKISATGMSAGAIMTHRIGCELSNRFAAIAPVEGTIAYSPCTPSHPISLFKIHGTADINIPFYGGYGCGGNHEDFLSVADVVQTWIDLEGCSCPYADASSCGQVVIQDGDGTCTQYSPCSASRQVNVIMCVIEGAGHAWSGVPAKQKKHCNMVTGTFNATLHISNFFMGNSYYYTPGGSSGKGGSSGYSSSSSSSNSYSSSGSSGDGGY